MDKKKLPAWSKTWLNKWRQRINKQRQRKRTDRQIISYVDFFAKKERTAGMTEEQKEQEKLRNKVLRWLGICLSITVAINQTLSYLSSTITPLNYWLLSLIFFALYCLFTPRLLQANENGLRIFLGIPWKAVGSGLHFVLWPFEKILRTTKTRIELEFVIEQIITSPGVYQRKDREPEKVEAIRINVKIGAYVSFGKDFNLIQAAQYLPPEILKEANNPKALRKLLEEFLDQLFDSTIRTVGAGKTWPEINDERAKFADEVKATLKLDPTFDQAGLADDLGIMVTNVELPLELQEAITKVEVATRNKEAQIIASEGAKQAEILTAEGKKQAGILVAEAEKFLLVAKAEAFKVELEKQKEGIGFDNAQAFADYLVAFEAAKGYGEGDKTVPVLFGGATNLFDLAQNIASTIKGVPPQDIKMEDIKNLLSTDEGKKLLTEAMAKPNNGEGKEVLGFLL